MNRIKLGLIGLVPVLSSLFVSKALAVDDYLITATDTTPIFTAAAAVGKANFISTAQTGLVYYVGFMVALVLLVLALLPVKKIWGVIAGHFS